MAERFPCEKCAGTGEVRWGRCHACKGRGSFASSPEKLAKRKLQRLDSRKAGAQLAEIKKHAPKRHAEMMKSYEDFEAARQ